MKSCVLPVSWILALCLLCTALAGQSIDRERSRFVTQEQGRAGCFAPFEVHVTGGGDSVEVISFAPGIELVHALALDGGSGRALVPVFVGANAGIRLRPGGDAWQPALPRSVAPSYQQPYTAVFAPDPVGARAALPPTPGQLACDYFETREFFADWRLFDGYDAIVIFNPGAGALAPGAQRAMAEFCSLGGCCLVAGTFQLGERAQDIPAPGEPQMLYFAGVPVQRFGYGAGAIFRVEYNLLREASAREVIRAALLHHLRFGAAGVPGGQPASRAAPALPPPLAAPQPAEAAPGIAFAGLASALLLALLLIPAVLRRLKRPALAAPGAMLGAACVLGLALLQQAPQPRAQCAVIEFAGPEAHVASTRTFLVAEPGVSAPLSIMLDGTDLRLARQLPGSTGWIVDEPLTRPQAAGTAAVMEGGMVNGLVYRDFLLRVHDGETSFAPADARLLAWWLESNAMRGRLAMLEPGKPGPRDSRYSGWDLTEASRVRVLNLRVDGD